MSETKKSGEGTRAATSKDTDLSYHVERTEKAKVRVDGDQEIF